MHHTERLTGGLTCRSSVVLVCLAENDLVVAASERTVKQSYWIQKDIRVWALRLISTWSVKIPDRKFCKCKQHFIVIKYGSLEVTSLLKFDNRRQIWATPWHATQHRCGFIPSAALGMKSTVFVLQRTFSPLPSIQTYITWLVVSGCGRVKYLAVVFLSSSAIVTKFWATASTFNA